MAKEKILVTNTCGFFGCNFIRTATYHNLPYNFVSIDYIRDPKYLNHIYVNKGHQFYLGNVADNILMRNIFLLEKPDYVVHFPDNSDDNHIGTQNLVNLSFEHKVKKFILGSSDKIYNVGGFKLLEESLTGKTKESINEDIVKNSELNNVIVRSCPAFGPWQDKLEFIPKVISALFEDRVDELDEVGDQLFDWMHIFEHCLAIFKLLEVDNKHRVVNISGGYELSKSEIANKISRLLSKKNVVFNNEGDVVMCRTLSNIKLLESGWYQTMKFNESLQQAVDWYSKNRYYLK